MLSKEFKEFAELLNSLKVEYLLVGGYAVVLYGYVRYTGDIDFWINPSKENAVRLIEVLKRFGFGSLNLSIEDFTMDDQIIQLGYPLNELTLLHLLLA